jgi:hypothetical protein
MATRRTFGSEFKLEVVWPRNLDDAAISRQARLGFVDGCAPGSGVPCWKPAIGAGASYRATGVRSDTACTLPTSWIPDVPEMHVQRPGAAHSCREFAVTAFSRTAASESSSYPSPAAGWALPLSL